jgi:hypothetical protein
MRLPESLPLELGLYQSLSFKRCESENSAAVILATIALNRCKILDLLNVAVEKSTLSFHDSVTYCKSLWSKSVYTNSIRKQ